MRHVRHLAHVAHMAGFGSPPRGTNLRPTLGWQPHSEPGGSPPSWLFRGFLALRLPPRRTRRSRRT